MAEVGDTCLCRVSEAIAEGVETNRMIRERSRGISAFLNSCEAGGRSVFGDICIILIEVYYSHYFGLFAPFFKGLTTKPTCYVRADGVKMHSKRMAAGIGLSAKIGRQAGIPRSLLRGASISAGMET